VRRARARWGVVPIAVALLATACGGGTEELTGAAPTASTSAGASLAGVCPETVVVQSNWYPQAEDGALYRLLGGKLTVDTDRRRVSGALVSDGKDTGVRLEIRSGGPAAGNVPAVGLLYTDPSITLATADTDQVIQVAGRQPVKAVVAQLDRSPVVLMFDPAQHKFRSVADIGRTDTKVLYFPNSTYMEYLTATGILRKSQVDAGYTGSPDRWVAARGSIVQQGFLTNEPYAYEKELPAWDKPVGWVLVADVGYPVYPEALTVKASREAELAPCLKRLVPVVQRSISAYAADPVATNDLIVRLVKDFRGYPYSAARAAYAVKVMAEQKIVGGGGNATVGDFDQARTTRLLGIVTPIFAANRTPVPAGLTADQVTTNAYIDRSIGM
jgi:hypothetical protein